MQSLPRWLACACLAATVLAGCAGEPTASGAPTVADLAPESVSPAPQTIPADDPAAPAPEAPRSRDPPAEPVDGPTDVALATLAPGELLSWSGDCPCPAFRFHAADDAAGWLEVRVRWDGTQVAGLGLDVTGPDGVARNGTRGFDAQRVQVWGADAGDYLVGIHGEGAFTADARYRATTPSDDAPRLPNLVTTVPAQVGLGSCDPVETAEQGAERCLRLGNGVANPGHGPLQVYLTFDQGALALAGQGRFVQRVLQADGSWEEHPVGAADLHPTHAHWHYEGLAGFSLHPVSAAGLRGEAATSHHKAGFCFLDWGRMPENETVAEQGGNAESDCLLPMTDGWSNGVSAGWYDFYSPGLTDQYVDVAGVPDGVYELVSVADPGAGMLESDLTDNAASVVLRLSGDEVAVLEERGWYRVEADDL